MGEREESVFPEGAQEAAATLVRQWLVHKSNCERPSVMNLLMRSVPVDMCFEWVDLGRWRPFESARVGAQMDPVKWIACFALVES